jgi:hypothetical protein
MITLAIVRVLQVLSGIVSLTGALLVAGGHWLSLTTSAPLILTCIAAAWHYKRRAARATATARSRACRERGSSETGSPRSSAHSSE